MTTLTQLLAEKSGKRAPPVSGRGVTLNDLLKEKAAGEKQPGALSQAAGVAGEILAPKIQGIMAPVNAVAKGVQGVADYFGPQPLEAPPGPDAGIGEQFGNVIQNAPRMTREFNRLVTPGTDLSGIQGFPGAGIVRGGAELLQRPIVGMSGRNIGRGLTGFLDAFSTIGRDIGVTGFEQGQKSGLPAKTAQMLDPFTSEPRDEIRRNPLLSPARGMLHAGSFLGQAVGPALGAADPAFQEDIRAGKEIRPHPRQAKKYAEFKRIEKEDPAEFERRYARRPDLKVSLEQGKKDFKEFIRQTLIGAQARQRGERDIGAENQAKAAETFVPPLIEEMKKRGANTKQIKSEVQRQIFNVGFTGDAAAAAGEIVAFEAAMLPAKAAVGGLRAFGAARRAADVEKKAALAQKALKTAPVENIPKPTVSAPSTVVKPAKAVPSVPKTVKGKPKVSKVLTQRAANIEKRVAAAGGDKATSDIIGKARRALEGGKAKEAEGILKGAVSKVEALEKAKPSAKVTPFKQKPAVVKKPVTKIEPPTTGGPLKTGILRSRIASLRKAGASPVQLDAAEAALKESLPKAEKLITAAEQGLKAPKTTPKPKAVPKAPKPKRPKAVKKTDAASEALAKKVKAKRKGLGKKGEAQLLPEGKSKKGKEILADLAAQAKAKKARPKAFGPSASQIEAADRSLRQLAVNIQASGKTGADYIRSVGGTADDVNRIIPQLKNLKDIEPFAGREMLSIKDILKGTGKRKKVSLEEFGEAIVADFVDEIPKQVRKKGLKATTNYVRKMAVEDLAAARGLGTGGDLAMKNAIRKIKVGDNLIDAAIAQKGDIPEALMTARNLYGSALNDVRAAAKVRFPKPPPQTAAPLPKAKTKAQLAATRGRQIEAVKSADVARTEARALYKEEVSRLEAAKKLKNKTGQKKLQAQIDKFKTGNPLNRGAVENAQGRIVPVQLSKIGGEGVIGGPGARVGRLKVKPAQRKTKGIGLFGRKPFKSEVQLAHFKAAEKAAKPLKPSTAQGFAQAPGAPKGPAPVFKPKPRPKAQPFKTEAERRAAMQARREAGKKFIRERIEEREGLYGSEVGKLLKQPANAKRLDKMMTQLKKAKAKGDTERVEMLSNAISKFRGELQGKVKLQAQSAKIRQLTKKMSDAFRRGNMTHYKNASDELERLIVKPKMREKYLEQAKELYDETFSKKTFSELRQAISDRSQLGEEGFARFYHDRPLRNADARAVAAAAEEALTKSIKELAGKAKGRGQSLTDFLVKTQRMNPKEAKSLVREANRIFKKSDELLDVGSINVERLQRQGSLSQKQADVMNEVNTLSEGLPKVPLTRAQVKATSGSPNVQKLNDLLWNYTDAELAAIPDALFAQMQGTLNEMINSGASASDSILAIRPMMQKVSRSGSMAGRMLQGLKEPANAGELMTSLKKMLKTAVDPTDIALIKAQIKVMEPLTPTNRMMAWRAYQEFSVNNVLSAGITQTRNLFGAGLEVLVRQPTDRITRAALTSMSKAIGTPMKNPAYWAEVLPEVRAIYGNVGKGIMTGARFFKHGSSQRLVNATMAEIKGIRGQLLQVPKGSKKFKALVSRRDRLWNQVRDVIEINANARTGEVFTGQQSTLRQLAARIENPVLRGAADTVAKVVNLPVRALVAGDAALTEMSFKGHKAAMQIRKALRKGMSVRDVGKLKFTAFERNQALQDSLYYLYRREWGTIAKAAHLDKLTHTPVFDNLFLFLRTRANILKNYVDNSPFGLVNVINESIKARGLDAKSFARFVNGTAIHFGLYQYAKAAGGRFVGPSKNKKERDLRRARSIPELYYEDKDGNVHDMSNIAPVTPIIGLTATVMEAERRGKLGQPLNDNMTRAMQQFSQAVTEDAIYADVKGIQRMIERWGETSEDPTAYGSQALYTDLARFATGRGLPNILRETKQSGKILGIPVGLQPDRSVVEPTGNFAQTLEQQIASDLPGWSPPNLRVSPLTGKPVVRSKRYTPFNPKFWTEGITPGENIPANEDRVVKEMLRVKAGYSGPKGSIAKKYINIKLNNTEKRHFIKVLSGAKYKGVKLLDTLDTIIQSEGYTGLASEQGGAVMQREILQSTISQFTEIGYQEAVKMAVARLMKTEEGRKRLWFSAYQGNPAHPYTGDIEHLKLLLRINNIPIQ